MRAAHFKTWLYKRTLSTRAIISLGLVLTFYLALLIFTLKCGIKDMYFTETVTIIFSFLILSFITFPELGRALKNDFVKSPSLKVIILPLILMPLLDIAILFLRLIPTLYGHEAIQIGASQGINTYNNFSFQLLIYIALLPALLEELFYRFIGFHGLRVALKNYVNIDKPIFTEFCRTTKTRPFLKIIFFVPVLIFAIIEYCYNSLYVKNNKVAILIWVILTSYLFSIAHGPSGLSHILYFIPGVAFAYFYLKYGLLSSIVAHFTGNYFSSIIHEFGVNLFRLLFQS